MTLATADNEIRAHAEHNEEHYNKCDILGKLPLELVLLVTRSLRLSELLHLQRVYIPHLFRKLWDFFGDTKLTSIGITPLEPSSVPALGTFGCTSSHIGGLCISLNQWVG